MAVALNTSNPSLINQWGIGEVGASGVDIFFVISGFIMFYTHDRDAKGLTHALRFLKKRCLRIYPVYWFWTAFILALSGAGLILRAHHFSMSDVMASVLLWPQGGAGELRHPVVDQGWTLSFEMYFYVVFALSLLCVRGNFRLLFLMVAFAVLSSVSRFIELPSGVEVLVRSPLIVEFLLGMIAAQLVFDHRKAGARWLSGAWLPRVLISLGIAGFVMSVSTDAHYGVRVFVWGIPAFLLVLGAVLYEVSSPVKSKLALFFGDASYSMYLCHGLFLMLLSALVKKEGLPVWLPTDAVILVMTPLIVILSSLTYLAIERPLSSVIRRMAWARS
jgi:exopolysaccharide production protein ExoZ